MKKVLIVEDDETIQKMYRALLKDKVILLQAYSVEEGFSLFQKNPDVALIVVDGCLGSGELNSLPLIRDLRRSFKGHMIAASGREDYRNEMTKKEESGEERCSRASPKQGVAQLVEFLLARQI